MEGLVMSDLAFLLLGLRELESRCACFSLLKSSFFFCFFGGSCSVSFPNLEVIGKLIFGFVVRISLYLSLCLLVQYFFKLEVICELILGFVLKTFLRLFQFNLPVLDTSFFKPEVPC